MATQDKTDTIDERTILEAVEASLEVAFEDADTIAGALDAEALARATFATTAPGVFHLTFANGERWEITATARVLHGPRSHSRDDREQHDPATVYDDRAGTWCMVHERNEASWKDGDHTPLDAEGVPPGWTCDECESGEQAARA